MLWIESTGVLLSDIYQLCCDPKWENFLGFVEDMGERPEDLTLDRVDVDGSYSAENCRWATYSQQNSNRRCMDSGETDHIPRVF